MTQTTVTVKGQVTIPKEVRDGLGIKTGDKVAFVFEGDRAILFPMKGDIFELRGILKKMGKTGRFDFKKIRQKAKEYIGKKYALKRATGQA